MIRTVIVFFILDVFIASAVVDKFTFIKGQDIYIESNIITNLLVNGEHHGVTESIERTIQKIVDVNKSGALINGITYSQQKTGLTSKKYYKVNNKSEYSFTKNQYGKEEFIVGRKGIRDFPLFTKNELNIGDTYQSNSSYFLNLFNKEIPDLFIDITFVYRYLGNEINNGHELSIYSANGVINQERSRSLLYQYKIMKVVGFSNNIIKFNRNEGIVQSIEEVFDWCVILNDLTVVEFSGRTNTSIKTPPPLPVENMMNIIKNKEFNDITLNKNLLLSINIENIQFQPDSAVFEESEKERIDNVVTILKNAGVNKFIIVGHTANVGNPGIQLRLSENRAKSVFNYLLDKHKFDVNNISFTGRGGTESLAGNDTEEGRAKNRRVEFIVIPD